MAQSTVKLMIKALIVFLFPLVMILAILYIFIRNEYKDKKNRGIVIIEILDLFMPSMIQTLFDSINCANIDGDLYYFVNDSNTICFSAEHYYWIGFFIVPTLILLCVFYPAFIFILIFKVKKQNLSEEKFVNTIGYVAPGLKQQEIYMVLIFYFKKIVMLMLAIFLENLGQKFILLVFFNFIFLFFYQTKMPLITKQLNKIAILSNISCILILLLLFLNSNSDNQNIILISSIISIFLQIIFIIYSARYIFFIKIKGILCALKEKKKNFKKFTFLNENVQKIVNEEFEEFIENLTKRSLQKNDLISEKNEKDNIKKINIPVSDVNDLGKEIELLIAEFEKIENNDIMKTDNEGKKDIMIPLATNKKNLERLDSNKCFVNEISPEIIIENNKKNNNLIKSFSPISIGKKDELIFKWNDYENFLALELNDIQITLKKLNIFYEGLNPSFLSKNQANNHKNLRISVKNKTKLDIDQITIFLLVPIGFIILISLNFQY